MDVSVNVSFRELVRFHGLADSFKSDIAKECNDLKEALTKLKANSSNEEIEEIERCVKQVENILSASEIDLQSLVLKISEYERFIARLKVASGAGASTSNNAHNKDSVIHKSLKGVEHRPIQPASTERSEQQIISSISGGDMTQGSCSSLALAYAGNKAGYVVYDFRDGKSREAFSSRLSIEQIANLDGVNSITLHGKDDTICAERLMSNMKPGKEYYMATGSHAAVVRLNSQGNYEYLELQSGNPSENGWHPLTLSALYSRFGCEDGQSREYSNHLINLDSLQSNPDFLHLLGYINTDKYSQVKGASGYVK